MSEQHGKSWLLGVAVATLAAISLSGCGIGSARDPELQLEVEKLERQRAELQAQLGQSQVEIKQLEEQIRALSGLPKDGRDNPYPLKSIKITRYTNFYDKDEDGRKEKLIVYVEPVDVEGDTLKAAGTAHVQLWNLNKPSDQALLGQWEVQPGELRKLWFETASCGSRRWSARATGSPSTPRPAPRSSASRSRSRSTSPTTSPARYSETSTSSSPAARQRQAPAWRWWICLLRVVLYEPQALRHRQVLRT